MQKYQIKVENEKTLDGENDKKKISIGLIIKVAIILIVILLFIEILKIIFVFTPEKWEVESWRPAIIQSLERKTDENFIQEKISKWIKEANEFHSEMIDASEIFEWFEKENNRYNLYFKTPEQVEDILGEENPKNYITPQVPVQENSTIEYRSYYCYGEENDARWIIIRFDKNYSTEVEFR